VNAAHAPPAVHERDARDVRGPAAMSPTRPAIPVAARFVDEPAALACLAVTWALLMPLVLALSERLDGVIHRNDHA
jgi:hypothetical protein